MGGKAAIKAVRKSGFMHYDLGGLADVELSSRDTDARVPLRIVRNLINQRTREDTADINAVNDPTMQSVRRGELRL